MEKQRPITEILADIENLAEDAGQMLRLCLEIWLEEYVDDYAGNVNLLDYIDSVMNDRNALLDYFALWKENNLNNKDMKDYLYDLFVFCNEPGREVLLYLLDSLFQDYAFSLNVDVSKKSLSYTNVRWERKDIERFYKALGFIADSNAGKGAHEKWYDPVTNGMWTISSSRKIWFRGVIRQLERDGVSLERLKEACDKIEFNCKWNE